MPRGRSTQNGPKLTAKERARASRKRNPLPQAAPAIVEVRLSELFAAAALIGLLASQKSEPDKRWCRDWSLEMGNLMALGALRQRKRGRA